VAEKRRLPVLSNDAPKPPAEDEDDEARPPYHWVGFGTVAIFAAWLPLTYVAGSVSKHVMDGRFGKDASNDAIAIAVNAMETGERVRLMATIALPALFALAIAAFGGGFVVGRFGPGTGAREAALAGVMTAIVANLLAWPGGKDGVALTALVGVLVTSAVAIGFAAWGGALGSRMSRRAPA